MSLINITNLTFAYDGSYDDIFSNWLYNKQLQDNFELAETEKPITTYKPTMLFVEHDRAFCKNIATKTVEVAPSLIWR